MGKMAEMQRKLLEQMMGPEAMGVSVQNHDWWSDRVCRNYLFGTCPHILFGNTKMDLGACPKIHSDRVLAQFKEAEAANPADPRIMQFRQEHENTLYGFIDEADRRIRMSQRKLEKTPEENRKTVDLMREIGEIELSIQGGTEEIEALGEAGKVEESMEKLQAVEALKSLKTDKERDLQNLNETAGASGHQKLRVCEICGAMLSVLDSDKRLADHFGGKLHLGYQELRKLIADFAEARMQGRIPGMTKQPGGPNGNAAPGPPAGPYMSGPPPSAPSGPSGGAPAFAPPSGPSGHGPSHGMPPFPLNGHGPNAPSTPLHPSVPPADEMPAVGHGDKYRREAGELLEDVRESREGRERGERGEGRERRGSDGRSDRDREYRDRERSSRGREDRYEKRESREDRYDKYDKYGDGDGERSRERGERSKRYSDYDDERYDKYKERKYDDDRRDRGSRYE